MSPKIIHSRRYQTITKKNAKKKKEDFVFEEKKNYSSKYKKQEELKKKKRLLKQKKKEKLGMNSYSMSKNNNMNEKNQNEEKYTISSKKKRKKELPKFLKVSCAIMGILLIGYASKFVIKYENMSIFSVFSNKEQDNLVSNYTLKIGILNLDTADAWKTQNIIYNEMLSLSTRKLVDINEDYTLRYDIAEKVEKIDEVKYQITLKKESNIAIPMIEQAIAKILQVGANNIYYTSVENIENMTAIDDNTILVTLKKKDPYFIYHLDFPIMVDYDDTTPFVLKKAEQNSILFEKNKASTTIREVSLQNYVDSDTMVEEFKDKKIDVFFATSDSIMTLIGKYDYSIKKYRDGQTLFLLGNKDSSLFQRKEVRKALAYSLNRTEIVSKVNHSFAEVIDLPYIYSGIQYKYDIYGAQNALLSNGWKKGNAQQYHRLIDEVDTNLVLKLLYNKEDTHKTKTAQIIKEMAEENGIGIELIAATEAEVQQKLVNKEYDIVLADVFIGKSPDIEYLKDFLNLNEEIELAMKEIDNSVPENIAENVKSLQRVLSEEIACIGIFARNTNIIYQKDISGFEKTNYMNIFNQYQSIGKLKEN